MAEGDGVVGGEDSTGTRTTSGITGIDSREKGICAWTADWLLLSLSLIIVILQVRALAS
jgi:hypothetical protein